MRCEPGTGTYISSVSSRRAVRVLPAAYAAPSVAASEPLCLITRHFIIRIAIKTMWVRFRELYDHLDKKLTLKSIQFNIVFITILSKKYNKCHMKEMNGRTNMLIPYCVTNCLFLSRQCFIMCNMYIYIPPYT